VKGPKHEIEAAQHVRVHVPASVEAEVHLERVKHTKASALGRERVVEGIDLSDLAGQSILVDPSGDS
jgi:hypothetical protein